MKFCVVPREVREINKRGGGSPKITKKINVPPLVYFEPETLRVHRRDSVQITTKFVLYLKILIDKIKIFDFFFKKGEKSRKRKEEKTYGLSYGHNIIVYAGRLVLKKTLFLRGQVR